MKSEPRLSGLRVEGAPEAGDFLFGSVLGQGSYAKVFHAKMKSNDKEFAVKVMDQGYIRKEKKTSFVITERKVLSRLHHPSIIRFYCSFKDSQNLYIVMELCRGGDFNGFIKAEFAKNRERGIADTACTMQVTQFYAAELVLGLEYMHAKRVIHRDLKPDNLLLSESGHLKITDFGTAKDQDDRSDVNHFGGTVSYVSPEVLNDEPAGRPCDLWALGCIVYQMLTGRFPFVADNDYLTFQKIINHKDSDELVYPEGTPQVARDFIRELLIQDPNARLGAEQNEAGYRAIKSHPFFMSIDWDHIYEQTPPVVPPLLELPTPRLDGAMENWTVAEYFLDESFDETSDCGRRSRISTARHGRPSYLEADEQVLLEAKVKVHSKVLSRTRQVLLTNAPRLMILSLWTGKLKGQVPLSKETRIIPDGPHTFDLVSPSSITYRFTDPTNNTQMWARRIAEVLGVAIHKLSSINNNQT